MIEKIANRLAAFLGSRLQVDQDEEEVYAYGLNILLGESFQILVVLVVALCLNILYNTAIVVTTYAAFCSFGGGPHMSTRVRCFLVTTTEMVALGLLSTFPVEKHTLYSLLFCVFLFNLIVIYKWVPAGTKKKPRLDPVVRKQHKRKTTIITLIWLSLNLFLLQENQTRYNLALILGAIDAMFMVTPIGYRLMLALDVAEIKGEGGELRESL